MVVIETVLLKVASRCNINCGYCYVFNMGDSGWARTPKLMTPETCTASAHALTRLAAVQGRPFSLVLHGGEPLLLGAARLGDLLGVLRHALPDTTPISIQTNGVLIDAAILDLCALFDVTLSVSLDGPREVHDRHRVAFSGRGTFDDVMAGLERLREHHAAKQLFTGVLAVVDPRSDAGEVYRFFRELQPPSVDFIYRDGNHSRLPFGKRAFHTTEYGEWTRALLDTYLADDSPVPIRVVDDLIKLVLGGAGSKAGVGITDYGILVIDTDGAITKNDTLKSVFDGADRFAEPWSVHTHALADVVASPAWIAAHAAQRPTNATCVSCADLPVCGGGMTLHRWRDETAFDNPSVYCADQQLVISHLRRRLRGVEGFL